MLPHTENNPSVFRQGAVYAAVAGLVAGNLLTPELRVGFGLSRVFRTTVPEAAVNENGDAKLAKNKIGADAAGASPMIGYEFLVMGSGTLGPFPFALGPSRREHQRESPPPPNDAIHPENLDQPPCRAVASCEG